MALQKYFQLKTTFKWPLPVPNGELSLSLGISSANACIGKLLNLPPQSGDDLSPTQKFEIGK